MRCSYEVANVRCGGCAATIKKALGAAGFGEVDVDLSCEPRKVTLNAIDEVQLAQFRVILRRLGYPLSNEKTSAINSAGLKIKSVVSCSIGKFALEGNTK